MSAVRWLGQSAVYTTDERAILAALPVREQAFLHTLKAFTEGELEDGRDPQQEVAQPVTGGHRQASSIPPTSVVYTDPEDIPFGDGAQTPRKRPVYALVWTPNRHRTYKTKAAATKAIGWWKKNKAGSGWKVAPTPDSAIARSPDGLSRHAISLHEYDPVTKERLR